MNTGASSYVINSKNYNNHKSLKGDGDFLHWQFIDTQKRFADRQAPTNGGGVDRALIAVGADEPPQNLSAAVASQALGPNDFTLMAIGGTRKLPARAAP